MRNLHELGSSQAKERGRMDGEKNEPGVGTAIAILMALGMICLTVLGVVWIVAGG